MTPRFQHTYCSQCGVDCGPGDDGASSCRDHQVQEPVSSDQLLAVERAEVARLSAENEKLRTAIAKVLAADMTAALNGGGGAFHRHVAPAVLELRKTRAALNPIKR